MMCGSHGTSYGGSDDDHDPNDLPGYEIDETLGEVFGLTVRSRNIGSQMGAGLKSMFGGELKGMTKALVDSREQVIERMVAEAEAKGGNAIVAMRFDTSEMGGTGRRSAPTARRCARRSQGSPSRRRVRVRRGAASWSATR